MLKKLTILFLIVTSLTISQSVYAKNQIGEILYPTNVEDQNFVTKFFQILNFHQTRDPFFEEKGPSVEGYSLDKIKFAFMTNETETTVDLVFFNWTLPVFEELEEMPELSKIYGSKVYTLRGVEKKLIASQGKKNDKLINFSYLFGSKYLEAQIRKENPGIQEIPKEFLDWKPHPEAMDRDHPLRKALGINALSLLSPRKEMQLEMSLEKEEITEEILFAFEAGMIEQGGFQNVVMGMMIHEMYHIKESEDAINDLVVKRDIPEDRKALVKQLKSDETLRSLFGTYAKIVFSLGDSLKNTTPSGEETEKLKELNIIINHLKTNYHNAWSFIWSYEYTEGFAEYVSAYSMIQGGVTSLFNQIDLQKSEIANNFTYRTGAIGGLYLAYRNRKMPFENNEDHRQSIWEIILEKAGISNVSRRKIEEIQAKYSAYPFEVEREVELLVDYLISTTSEDI